MHIYIYILFILAIFERTVLDLGPNVELITLAMLAASIYLSRSKAFKLTFLLMAATDLVIGNTTIFVFTWSGFLLPTILIPIFKIRGTKLEIIKATGLGVLSNLFFFIWTNFGVWLLDSWSMYSKSIPSLIHCYVNALPFLRLQLASTLLFVPVGFYLLSKYSRARSIAASSLASSTGKHTSLTI